MCTFAKKGGREGPASRRGSVSLEVTLAAAITLPIVAFLAFGGVRACLRIYQVVAGLVAMPVP